MGKPLKPKFTRKTKCRNRIYRVACWRKTLRRSIEYNRKTHCPVSIRKIRIAKVCEYDYDEVSKQIDELIALSHTYNDMAIVEKMKEIVPEYISNNSKYSVLDKKNE